MNEVLALIITYIPSAAAAATAVLSAVKIMNTLKGTTEKNITALRKDLSEIRKREAARERSLTELLRENTELKKTLNTVLTKIDHVRRD